MYLDPLKGEVESGKVNDEGVMYQAWLWSASGVTRFHSSDVRTTSCPLSRFSLKHECFT